MEPPSLCPLLEVLSQAQDRQGLTSSALEHVVHSAVVSERGLGYAHRQTVRLLLERLRLRICCATNEGLSDIGKFATDVSRRLDILSRVEPVEAQRLTKRCAELVSLSCLLSTGEARLPADVRTRAPVSAVARWEERLSVGAAVTTNVEGHF